MAKELGTVAVAYRIKRLRVGNFVIDESLK